MYMYMILMMTKTQIDVYNKMFSYNQHDERGNFEQNVSYIWI